MNQKIIGQETLNLSISLSQKDGFWKGSGNNRSLPQQFKQKSLPRQFKINNIRFKLRPFRSNIQCLDIHWRLNIKSA
jgi:hypothetical protein